MTTAPLRVGLIGSGRMAAIYGDVLAQRSAVRIVGVVGNTDQKTRALAERFGVRGHPGGQMDELIASADAFALVTPEWVRVDQLERLVATERPILVEKPLAASERDADAIRRLPSDARARITVAHTLRFSPRFSQARAIVAEGQIGEIRHMHTQRNPNRETVKRVLGRFNLAYWLSCHDVDLMRWFTESEIESVRAFSRNRLRDSDDFLIAHLRFANGVEAVHEVSWCTPPLSAHAPMCRFSIKGTEGLIEIDDSYAGVDVYRSGDRVSSPDTHEVYEAGGRRYGIFAALIDRWIDSVTTGKPAYPSFDDALHAVDVCTAISRSIESNQQERVRS